MNSLYAIANAIMKLRAPSMLGADSDSNPSFNSDVKSWTWVNNLVNALKSILGPVLAVVAAAGCIYAVVIAVQMARADTGEKREEAKKRLITVIVAIAVLVVLIVFFIWLLPLILERTLNVKINDYNTNVS